MNTPLRIAGVGHYLPERVVPSSEVEDLCGLKRGWIERRTGVRERRWVNGETNAYMAAEAAREAVADAGMKLTDIDLILNASGTPQQAIPDMAPLIQRELGLGSSGITCFSIHATCLSFLVGLDMAAMMLAADRFKSILVISADIGSCSLNFKEPESASLFGDAAAAVVVCKPKQGETGAVLASRFETYGEGANLTELRGGGSRKHPNCPNTTPEDNLFAMEGPKIFRMARKYVDGFLDRLRPGLSRGPGDIRLVVSHQMSIHGLRSLRRNNIPDEMVMVTLDRFGNCISASLPLTLYEAVKQGRLQRGDSFLLCGTGAGLSLAAMIVTY